MIRVYGGNTMYNGQQVRAIVATTSQARAAELVGESLSYIHDYWSITANASECQIARAFAGKALVYVNREWVPIETGEVRK